MIPPSLRNRQVLKRHKQSNGPRKWVEATVLGGLMTWNVGGLRTNLEGVRTLLQTHKPAVMALQETRVAREHQTAMQNALQKEGYMTVWSPASRWGLDRRGRHVLRIGEIPGTAFIHREGVSMATCTPMTAAGREYAAQGRLLIDGAGC